MAKCRPPLVDPRPARVGPSINGGATDRLRPEAMPHPDVLAIEVPTAFGTSVMWSTGTFGGWRVSAARIACQPWAAADNQSMNRRFQLSLARWLIAVGLFFAALVFSDR